MDDQITVEEYQLLSDEDKTLYYEDVSINIMTKVQTHSYELWSVRRARDKDE